MTTSELADFLLIRLYEKAEEEGHDKIYYLNDLAKDVRIGDMMKLSNATNILYSRGYLNIFNETIGGGPRANISGEGCLYVERGGNTEVIKTYRQSPEAFIVNIDKSIKIHGDIVQSNISSHTKKTTQNISINNEIQSLIAEMRDALKNDASISPTIKEDLMLDIETLTMQVSKTTKNPSIINNLLGNFSNIASISSFAMQLYKFLT